MFNNFLFNYNKQKQLLYHNCYDYCLLYCNNNNKTPIRILHFYYYVFKLPWTTVLYKKIRLVNSKYTQLVK